MVASKVREHEPLPSVRLIEYSDFNLNLMDIMVRTDPDPPTILKLNFAIKISAVGLGPML